MERRWIKWVGLLKAIKNKSPRHSLPGDFQPKPYHNVNARHLQYY
jgi:hypothetical protein